MTKLKTCPFCGGDNIQLSSHTGYRARVSPTGEIFTIRCLGCGVEFPSEYGKDLLVGKWNIRSVQDKHAIIANHLNVLAECIKSVSVPEYGYEHNIKMRDAILNIMESSVKAVSPENDKDQHETNQRIPSSTQVNVCSSQASRCCSDSAR
jgi:Lar family restriction alleviation protein